MSIKEMYEYFQSIPEEKWCIGTVVNSMGQSCALGHLAIKEYGNPYSVKRFSEHELPKVTIIKKTSVNSYCVGQTITGEPSIIAAVNNGETKYQQETPKQRMLAYLEDCLNTQIEDITKELAILPPDEKSDLISSPKTLTV